jgi:DNA processing protein
MTTGLANRVVSDTAREYLRLHLTTDIGPVRLRNLVQHFGSVDAVRSASMAQLQRVTGVGPKIAEAILRARDDAPVDQEVARAAECGVRILCAEDDEYPRGLLHIPDPPVCLYLRGRITPADALGIAIVGTRRCSHYGQEQAVRFGEILAGAGFTVVSGLARGVDSHAHRGALHANGRTIAVLGNGLSSIYPPEHASLADEIAASGAVVTELPVDVGPDAGHFPRRNRIIAGLSLGVIVIEAGQRSGALITARVANEYNREVFAVPGRVDRPDLTAGVNGLIRDGAAKLITCLEDVLDELGDVGRALAGTGNEPAAGGPVVSPNLSPQQTAVLQAVSDGAEDIERITETAQMDAAQVLPTLTMLELRGLIRRLPGDRFVCRNVAAKAGST